MSVKQVNNSYEKLVQWLKLNKGKSFSLDEAMSATNLSMSCISVFIWRRIDLGMFEKNTKQKPTTFKLMVDEIPLEIPKGYLSDIVFEIIKGESQKSLALYFERWSLVRRTQEKVPNATYNSVSAIIARWFRDGYVKKHPNKKAYRLLNPNMENRPITKAKR